jgi:hypothetical protein
MATVTWEEPNVSDLNWGTASNWSTGAVPGAGDDVVIPSGTPDVDSNVGTVNSITLDTAGNDPPADCAVGIGSDGELAVTTGVTLNLNTALAIVGSMTIGGTLTDDGAVLQLDGGCSVNIATLVITAAEPTNSNFVGLSWLDGDVTIGAMTNAGEISLEDANGVASGNVTVTGTLTNTGECLLPGDTGSVTIGTLANQSGGTIVISAPDSNNGAMTVTVTTLTNASLFNGNTTNGGGIDIGGGADVDVTGTTVTNTNTGDIKIGGKDAQMTISGTLDNQATGGLEVNSGALNVGTLTNEGVTTSSALAGIGVDYLSTATGSGALNVGNDFTNQGNVGIGNGTTTPTVQVNGTLDNQANGLIDLNSGTLTAATLTNEGVNTSSNSGGIAVAYILADAGSATLNVGDNFTNTGAVGIGDGANAPTVTIGGTLDNQAAGAIDLDSGTLTVTTLTNEGITTGSTPLGIGVDSLPTDTGPATLNVQGTADNNTNLGDFYVGNGATAPTVTIAGTLANQWITEVYSGNLNIAGAFTNAGSGEFVVGDDVGSGASTVTIGGTLDNQSNALTEIYNGANVTVTTLTNEGVQTGAASKGVDIGTAPADTTGGSLTVKGVFTNTGEVQIGNHEGASTPSVNVGTLNNGNGVNGTVPLLSLLSGTLTVATLNNNGPDVIDVDVDVNGVQQAGSGNLVVTGIFTNSGDFSSGGSISTPSVTIGTLNNQNQGVVSVNSGSLNVTGTFTNNGTFSAQRATVTIGAFDNESYADIESNVTVSGSVTNNFAGPPLAEIGIQIYGGDLTIKGALNGNAPVDLAYNGNLEIGTTATGGGSIDFSSGTQSLLEMDGAAAPADPISGFAVGDQIDLAGLAYQNDGYVLSANAESTTLEVDAPGGAVLATLTLTGNLSGVLPIFTRDSTGGTLISLISVPAATASSDSVSSVTGQPYTAYEELFNQGTFVGIDYFFTNPPSGATYSSYAYEYSAGNEFIGSGFDYANVTGEPYTGTQYNYDGAGGLTSVDFTGITGAAYSSYEYDYVGAVFAGSKFIFTTVPTGATYSSYELDFDHANNFLGDKFFFTDVTGQAYTDLEEDFDANSALTRVLLTGVTGQAYSSLEEDYSAGTYTGYKAYYTITGESFTNEEVDVSATNQLEKVVYSGLSSTPYSSVEEDFSAGVLTGEIYDFTNVSGAGYYAYQVDENANGIAQQEILDNNDGSHTIIGLGAAGQTFTTIADDTFTGGGANETFVFQPIYGSDTITDFYQYTSGATHDTISLSTAEFANFAAVLSAAQNVGANTVITATNGDTLTLDNVSTAMLSANPGDFTFHA